MNYWKFWIPILKKQYFRFKLQNDKKAIIDLEANIWKNWHLTREQKKKIWKTITGDKL